ncbi:hypothetical protein JCM1841_005923 [Sporobolomyces salmonicolor]
MQNDGSSSSTSHPLSGVGYTQSPTSFDILAHTAALNQPHPFPVTLPPPPGSSSGSGASSQIAQHAAKKKARKSNQVEGDEDGGEPGEEGGALERKRARTKQSLSCGECKRRKIKCDRKIPCSACIKRGTPDGCSWEDAKIEPERQPFALADDLDDLRERLCLVEKFINLLPPSLKASFAELGVTQMGSKPEQDVKDDVTPNNPFHMLEMSAPETSKVKAEMRCPPADNLGLLENALLHVGQRKSSAMFAPHAELTSALTCIVAPRFNYVDPSSATNLGLNLVFSQEELLEERARALSKVYSIMPNKEESYKALERYRDAFHWFFTVLHLPSLYAEHDRYWEMVEAGRRDEVDPAWMALYCLIIALGCDHNIIMPVGTDEPEPAVGSFGSGFTKQDRATYLYAAAQKLLWLADPFGKPQWMLVAATDGGDFGRFSSWLATAIRTGQKLGLHQLTDDPENMPPDDPAWPPGKNAVKREGALRLWSFMLFFDHLAASARFKAYMINPAHTTTPPLSNIDSASLSATDWRIQPSPSSILTDASLERHKYQMAVISRKTFDSLIAGAPSFNYGIILELDREYRELLAHMPDVFAQEYSSLEAKDPFIRAKRYLALQGVHNRLVRLHRPFLSRGWDPSSKFAYSADACIKSAKIVLVSHHNNMNINRNLKMMYSHSLSAAIVLAADLYHSIDIGATDAEIEGKKDTLVMGLEIFSERVQSQVASRYLHHIIEQARRVLSGLFLEVEKRRARKAARAAAGTDGAEKEEAFADILQRLTRDADPAAAFPHNQPADQGCATMCGGAGPPAAPAPLPSHTLPTQFAPHVDALPSFNAASYGFDASSFASLPGATENAFPTTFLSDMGMINLGSGQMFDYWSQGDHGLQNGANGGTSAGPSPPDIDLSFLGVGEAGSNRQDAAQALLNQLTGGW